ncbi:MAG: hypothetical protein HOL85_05295 [Rhodospirillaceae bacterium]|jgi:hypothetical protein|nr:hypothetical protein [Rhodospirillaceae bacterium]
MGRTVKLTIALALATSLGACSYLKDARDYVVDSVSDSDEKSMAHGHMHHVSKAWKDTPGGKGLLPTAMAEAKTALTHAKLASKKGADLKTMKMHTVHVLHAVDPSVEKKGPGLGYGVLKATRGVVKHIGLAASAKSASKNIKTHAVHVASAAKNTVTRAEKIVFYGRRVLKAKTAAMAKPWVANIANLAKQLGKGVDANGDKKISWHDGEGGLAAAKKHMGFMMKGEKMM